jgi:hypothetical protein
MTAFQLNKKRTKDNQISLMSTILEIGRNTHSDPNLRKLEDATKAMHALPTGATPVPLVDNKRELDGWQFHFKGWT